MALSSSIFKILQSNLQNCRNIIFYVQSIGSLQLDNIWVENTLLDSDLIVSYYNNILVNHLTLFNVNGTGNIIRVQATGKDFTISNANLKFVQVKNLFYLSPLNNALI